MRSHIVTLLVVACALVVAGAPVRAEPTLVASGATTLTGALDLPSASCPDTDPCAGSFVGSMNGKVQGTQGLDVFDVVWKTRPDDVAASVNEWDVACGPTGAGVVTARGTGSAVIGPGYMMGIWYRRTPGGTFPYTVIDVRISFSFEWEGTGSTGTLRLVPGAIDLNVHGLGIMRVVDGLQEGVAHYAPSTTACTPGAGTTGEVTAAFALR